MRDNLRLKCPICSHQWDENISPGARSVLCPECVGEVKVPPRKFNDAQTKIISHNALTEKLPTNDPQDDDSETGSKYHDGQTLILPKQTPQPRPAIPPITSQYDETRIIPSADHQPTAPTAPRPQPFATNQEPNNLARPTTPTSRQEIRKQYHELIGRTLDGYRIEKLLGAGGMGAVYLAHQMALDRKVALKILPAHLAANFDLVARFTREALSAAQLAHHNVIQVYDVGTCDGIQYIVMEYVRGDSLGNIIRRDGPLRVDDAAGYVLQSARGLHYAHQRGIIHRDIKPDNLMLNEHGIIKIADMGLAKMRGIVEENRNIDTSANAIADTHLELTQNNIALGTPAYMAPEQARDTASVDPRADQYSLGCTLYYLCAGKAPYSGTTAFELISKHLSEPLVPIESHVRGVPPAFSEIIRKMLAKAPEDRYPSLKDAAAALEQYLGIESEQGQYKPREHHLAALEDAQKSYYSAPSLKHRKWTVTAFIILMPLIIALAFLSKDFPLIGGAIGLLLLMPLASIIINGIAGKTYLYRRLRAVVFGMGWKSWLKTGLGATALIAFLLITGWITSWLVVIVIAVGAATAYQTMILRPLSRQRTSSINSMNEMLKELRLRGLPEEAIQDFLRRFSGADWEEFFEEFFTYEQMLLARAANARAEKLKPRRKHATWRDPIFRTINRIDQSRRETHEKKILAKAETNRFKSQGVAQAQAEEMAAEEATRILRDISVSIPEEDHEVIVRSRPKIRRVLNTIFRLTRLAIGLTIAALFAAAIAQQFGIAVPLPGGAANFVQGYYAWGILAKLIGLLCGAALLLTAFSRRIFTPALATAGALLLIYSVPIVRILNQPLLNAFTAFWTGVILVATGFGYCLLAKLTSGRF